MQSVGFGDLAASYKTSQDTARLKNNIARLSHELASGQRELDFKSAVNFANIDVSLTRARSFAAASMEAAFFVETAQLNFGQIQDRLSTLAPALANAGTIGTEPGLTSSAQDARNAFFSTIESMNAKAAGRSFFSGTSVDQPALADGETILAELNLAIAAATDAGSIETAVDDWFDTVGGGFETLGYLGATTDLDNFGLGANEKATFDIRADDQRVRDILKGLAKATLLTEGALGSTQSEQADLMLRAANSLLNANQGLTQLRGKVGTIEAQIEGAVARGQAEASSLELARSKIVEADPFRTATELQSTEVRLEAIYAITARLSRLSLIDFLR